LSGSKLSRSPLSCFNPTKFIPLKLFNYYIQATETETNIRVINEIQQYLGHKKTKLVLYIYDAFIFDFSKEDHKHVLLDLHTILSEKFPVKIKTGRHYGALQ